MENSRIIELMAKKAGKGASPEELEELGKLLASNPTQAFFHEVIHALKGNQGTLRATAFKAFAEESRPATPR